MTRAKKPPIWTDITTEIDGKSYYGKYTVDGKVLTVLYRGGTKSTQLGGSSGPALAVLLLGELVRGSR